MRQIDRQRTLVRGLYRTHPEDVVTDDHMVDFLKEGKFSVPNALPTACIDVLWGACQRIRRRPLPVTRGTDESWHNVKKITLAHYPQATGLKRLEERLQPVRPHAPELLETARWTDAVVRMLGNRLIQNGWDDVGNMLTDYSSCRTVVNYMDGSPGDPAVLGEHTDPPAQRGANAVITIGEGIDLMTGETVKGNTLNVYACHDVSQELGLDSPRHGFSSSEQRISIVSNRS